MSRNSCFVLSAYLSLVAASVLFAQDPHFSRLNKYQTPVPYPGVRGWHLTQNLGSTGVRGWIYGNNARKPDTEESREILVKSVEKGSPADGLLLPYDIILGVSAGRSKPKLFTSDARLELANAITLAEGSKARGELRLLRWRDGKTAAIKLSLPVMGDYASTAPFDCQKTQRIVRNAADYVAANMPPQGDSGMTGAIDGLFLLGTGDERYLDNVRRTANRLTFEAFSDGGHNTWRWGYVNLFLTEYYLATGDERVLPRIEEYSRRMADGQCNPGTWGHKSVEGRIPPGYGSMNQAGLIAFMSLVTARQCGVPFDYTAIANSISFYGSYAGRGGIPYGDHAPDADSSCNGKNGSAAVVFHILGADPAAQWFARLCASANLGSFEGGHTGNYFNQLWTPLGAGLTGRANTQSFWGRFNSYRDLARRWDGTFVTQPLPHVREGDLGFGNYVRKGPDWSTAAFALGYLVSNNELAILGRTGSVFAGNVSDELKSALALYRQKKFAECRQALDSSEETSDPVAKKLAGQLSRAADRNLKSIDLTLADMRRNLKSGDLFNLKHQLQAAESVIDSGDERLADFQKAVNDPDNADVLLHGERYYSAAGGHTILGRNGFVYFAPRSQSSARNVFAELAGNAKGYYQERARALLKAIPEEAAVQQIELVSKLEAAAQEVKSTFDVPDPRKVQELLLTWDLSVGGGMRVLLNGTLIMDVSIDPGPWRNARDTLIPLKLTTLELLKKGENELSIQLHPDRKAEFANCKLDAVVGK